MKIKLPKALHSSLQQLGLNCCQQNDTAQALPQTIQAEPSPNDKQKELELGLGLEYLPEGFVPPVKKGGSGTKTGVHWIWYVIATLMLVYVVFPAVTFILAPFLGLLMAGIVAVSIVGICLVLLVASQCNSWKDV